MTGIGFVFTDSDPYTGVDIDNCRNPETGQIAEWAWEIIRALNSYTEVSPSGTGVHTIVCGKLPVGKGNQVAYHDGKVELFSQARYFTVTGIRVDDTPADVLHRQTELLALHERLFASRNSPKRHKDSPPPSAALPSDDELIARARRAQNGSKFERLWNGQWEGDYPSQSEADLALCCLLAFWTGKDPARMDALFKASGLMRQKWLRKVYRDDTITMAITHTNQTWTSGGGQSAKELAGRSATQRSAAATTHDDAIWEPPVPFHQFNLPSFPTEALPDWLRAFVEAEATATQTPVDLACMLALSIIGASCAKKVVVRMKEGYFEPLNIFTVTALPPGNRKTAVFSAVAKPLEDYERAVADRESGEIAKKLTAWKIKESMLKRRQEAAANAKGKDQERLTQEAITLAAELAGAQVPVPTRCIADDCTPEKLATLLRDQGGRIALMSPEGDVFDLMAGRYSANGTGNLGVYLKGHAGDTLRIDRVGRPPDFVKAPALTLGLAVQPEVIRGLAEKPGFRGRGLLGRILFSLPTSLLGRRDTNPPPVPDNVRSAYHTNVIALLNLPVKKDENGDSQPNVLSFDPDARAILSRFEAWVEPQLSEFGELGGITDWAGKFVGAVGRIAGHLHMADLAGLSAPWEIPIPPETVERAIRIGRYLIPHAKAAFAEMGADAVVEQSKSILRWIDHETLDCFTKRDAHQALRGRFKRVDELDPPLALLESHWFIRTEPQAEHTGPGRRRSQTYEVNPRWARRTPSAA